MYYSLSRAIEAPDKSETMCIGTKRKKASGSRSLGTGRQFNSIFHAGIAASSPIRRASWRGVRGAGCGVYVCVWGGGRSPRGPTLCPSVSAPISIYF
jgi:hypothetical protein